ncbi:AAA family ATPase [Thiofaba sp. EF100]|uniref:AAA family ATPase n=1 Tax=Thiofaba sp. EF100 TaxID=3121274 RepID=UPI0032217440
MMNLKVVALVIQESTAQQLFSSLSRLEGVDFDLRMHREDERPLSSVGVEELPDVVILEINGHHAEDITDVERILHDHGDKVTVFVTVKDGNIDIIRRLMRAGVRDVLVQPIQTQELVIEITRILSEKRARQSAEQGRQGHILSFLNAKGGSGGSTLAVNVAHALASQFDLKVVLVDLDLQFGVCALFLDLKPQATVLEALNNPARIDPVFVQALLTPYEGGLRVLASPADVSISPDMDPDTVSALLHALAAEADVVIVDLPRQLRSWTLAVMQLSDPLMLVIQNTLSTLRDARLLLDALPRLGVTTEHVEFVNNRAMADSPSVSIDHLKETLSRQQIHRVRNDFELAVHAQDIGRPLAKVSERSPLTKDVFSLAEQIAERYGAQPASSPGLLKRLFNIH